MRPLRRIFIFLNMLAAVAAKNDYAHPNIIETHSRKEPRHVLRQNTESETTSAESTTTGSSSQVSSSASVSTQDASSTHFEYYIIYYRIFCYQHNFIECINVNFF
ncbi:unnamed protein product [Clonostachys rosea]|uniref:Uncharacterized protein n=1 Tax=Bionectria ochroleuca TaxID=29856 RepID=A0ABY6UTG1_BIOOC|nr:unnamed protein product [Clonostachys rosea]